jgi:hypothetical protein
MLGYYSVARAWAAPPHGVGSLWTPSGSRSVLVLRQGKIRLLELVSSSAFGFHFRLDLHSDLLIFIYQGVIFPPDHVGFPQKS